MNNVMRVIGKGMYLSGEHIDTDRIIPARFLKCVTFKGIEAHLFEDERATVRAKGEMHPFDNPANAGSTILVTDTDFGCGSSREHAVQCIMRWGIKAIVSCAKPGSPGFADIFRGNAAANGIPCVEMSPAHHEMFVKMIKNGWVENMEVRLDSQEVVVKRPGSEDNLRLDATMREDHRQSLMHGTWDTISVLLEAGDLIEKTAARLSYLD